MAPVSDLFPPSDIRPAHGHGMEANMLDISSLSPKFQFQEAKAELRRPITAKDIQLIKS